MIPVLWNLVVQVSRGHNIVVLKSDPMTPEVASAKDSISTFSFQQLINRKM